MAGPNRGEDHDQVVPLGLPAAHHLDRRLAPEQVVKDRPPEAGAAGCVETVRRLHLRDVRSELAGGRLGHFARVA
jgi:hypothetical protein